MSFIDTINQLLIINLLSPCILYIWKYLLLNRNILLKNDFGTYAI